MGRVSVLSAKPLHKLQLRDVKHCRLASMTEAQRARQLVEGGQRVLLRHGRYWMQNLRGFYESLHLMARMNAGEARRPTFKCWGFRTSLNPSAEGLANGMLPVHVLEDVSRYDIGAIGAKPRNHLRKCQRLVELVELAGPELLREQGYEVLESSRQRTGFSHIPTREKYLASIERGKYAGPRVVIAGLINGALGGYLTAKAVEGTAYVGEVTIATEALPTQIGTGLVFELVRACRRSGEVREVVYGLDSRENEGLVTYKVSMKFPVVQIPTRVHVNPLAAVFLRRWRPHVYYRLTGRS
jgi:hypothetical protein